MCRFVDRREKIDLFRFFVRWKQYIKGKQGPGSKPPRSHTASSKRPSELRPGQATESSRHFSSQSTVASRTRHPSAVRENPPSIAQASGSRTVNVPSSTSASPTTAQDESSRPRSHEFVLFVKDLLPQPLKDTFKDDPNYVPRNQTTAFTLTSRIPLGNAQIPYIAHLFSIPNLRSTLLAYFNALADDPHQQFLPFAEIDCWDRVRLQLKCEYDENVIVPQQTVMASPPSSDWPSGLFNFVLVNLDGYSNAITPSIKGMDCFRISQLHFLMLLHRRSCRRSATPRVSASRAQAKSTTISGLCRTAGSRDNNDRRRRRRDTRR